MKLRHKPVGPGACDIRKDGFTRWNAGLNRQHFYNTQKLPTAELEAVMEQLLVNPPKRGRTVGTSSPAGKTR